MKQFLSFLFLLLFAVARADVTPAQYLQLQQKPNFKAGHHLPHLTEWGWGFSSNMNVECALDWGYTLDLGDTDSSTLAEINTTNSTKWQYIQLAKNDPTHYALSINLTRDWPTNLSNGYWVTNSAGQFVDNDTNLTATRTGSDPVSPEAADSDLTLEAAFQTAVIKSVVSNAPVAIILNGGERDLDVVAGSHAWKFDPRVQVQAVMTNVYPKISGNLPSSETNGESWTDYISQRKGHQLSFLLNAVKAAAPSREFYIYYNTGNEQNRYTIPGYGWWEDNWGWGWNSAYMNTNATDLPSFEDYYGGGDSWTNATGDAWNQISDKLTHHLDGVGYNLLLGYTNNDYSWFCGGWSNTDTNRLANISMYTGFLKCLYTAGSIGGVAGYFEYPTNETPGSIFGGPGFDASFPTNSPPHWLLQMMALSHVHALFSHLDSFLTNSDILSGPQMHVWSWDQPAYEFTNTIAAPNDRVLARKLRGQNQWIVTAWAADGISTNVTVNIPTIGNMTVAAVPSASVYQVTIAGTTTNVTLLDEYGSWPSSSTTVNGNLTIKGNFILQ